MTIAASRPPVPAVEIHLHDDVSGCRGEPGFYAGGRIDLCPGLRLTLIARHNMLHELAHAWSVYGVSGPTREWFMAERGLTSWAEGSAGWALRGFEQVAEIVAWGIGDGVIQPRIADNGAETMTRMFELLTGRAPVS